MDDLIVEEKGYTVIYETAKGGIGYIGIDDYSGGYPYFADWIENRHVFKNVGQASGLLESAKKMNRSCGADKVHFGTMRVVKVATVFQEVDVDYDKILYNQAIKKISKAELDVIKRHVNGEQK